MTPAPAQRERRRLYVDTSAYLCMLLAEHGADRLSAETSGAELLSSVAARPGNAAESGPAGERGRVDAGAVQACLDRVDQDQQLFVLRDLTLDLCESNPLPAITTPRSLDLAHLRTALWFHRDSHIARFVTMDGSQEEAAQELGLPV